MESEGEGNIVGDEVVFEEVGVDGFGLGEGEGERGRVREEGEVVGVGGGGR